LQALPSWPTQSGGRFAPDPRFVLPPKLYGEGGNTVAIACADLNGDGAPDLLMATDANSESPGLQRLLNDGQGHFTDATAQLNLVFLATDRWVYAIQVVDINNDGLPDIVLRTISRNTAQTNLARTLLLNRGGGRFVDASEVFQANTNTGLAVGDFDRDGRVDLLVVDPRDTIRVFRSIKTIEAALFDD
jgi:hypothetical protein